MNDKFKNKYRISSASLQNWDYGWNAPYFVTICTQNRVCYFGGVVDDEMQLSEIGKIVKTEWIKTFEMRPDMNLTMDEFIIMPNHFHAIIVIGENKYNTGHVMERRDAMHCVSTEKNEKNEKTAESGNKNQFGAQKIWHPLFVGLKLG